LLGFIFGLFIYFATPSITRSMMYGWKFGRIIPTIHYWALQKSTKLWKVRKSRSICTIAQHYLLD
jgi:hypothetical protein